MLDVTGSMNANGKLDAMKLATKDVIDELLKPNGNNTLSKNKIALAPFSAAVNVGPYLADVAAGTSVHNDTCVIERPAAAVTLDQSPAIAPANVMTDLDPAAGDYRYGCPNAEIKPLSNDKNDVWNTVQSYQASGWTAGHIGAAWGWHLLSPAWGSALDVTPASYTDDGALKAVLIMTDGVFNTSYQTGPENAVATQTAESYAQFSAICEAMKLKQIMVFTVAFALSSEAEPGRTTAKTALETCAGAGGRYFDAESNADLKSAFKSDRRAAQQPADLEVAAMPAVRARIDCTAVDPA